MICYETSLPISVSQAHSSVERACLLGAVHCHKVESDENEQMVELALGAAIASDKEKGLIPFFVCTVCLLNN